MTTWPLAITAQTTSGVAIDSQIIGAVLAALLTGMFGWMAWLTVQQVKLMILASRVQPIVDAIYRDLPAIAKLTNPKPYSAYEQGLIEQWHDDPDLLTDEELERLRQAFDMKWQDDSETAGYRTVAALQQAAVRGEIESRRRRNHPFWRLLWAFR